MVPNSPVPVREEIFSGIGDQNNKTARSANKTAQGAGARGEGGKRRERGEGGRAHVGIGGHQPHPDAGHTADTF